jgi:hypothetical protein
MSSLKARTAPGSGQGAALVLVDADGLDGLTMRRLIQALGHDPIAVPAADLRAAPVLQPKATGGWRRFDLATLRC